MQVVQREKKEEAKMNILKEKRIYWTAKNASIEFQSTNCRLSAVILFSKVKIVTFQMCGCVESSLHSSQHLQRATYREGKWEKNLRQKEEKYSLDLAYESTKRWKVIILHKFPACAIALFLKKEMQMQLTRT